MTDHPGAIPEARTHPDRRVRIIAGIVGFLGMNALAATIQAWRHGMWWFAFSADCLGVLAFLAIFCCFIKAFDGTWPWE